MVNETQSVLGLIIDELKKEGSTCDVRWEKVPLYDISSSEFLSFVRQDLEEYSEKGRINALSNAKRAIECRVDEILTLSNLKSFSSRHRWGLLYKLEVLKKLGVVAPPQLIRSITSKRNLLEHEYVRPSREETINFAGITELFLSATDKYVEKGYISSATLTTLTKEATRRTISSKREMVIVLEELYKLEFDRKTRALTIRRQLFEIDMKVDKGRQIDMEYYKSIQSIYSEARKLLDESELGTIVIGDCKVENVTELMKLLWGKAC
jgi:hypothetical protein